MTALPPLPLSLEHWRCRWLHLDDGHDIHRVAQIAWEDDEMIYGPGVTVCGKEGHLRMPGIFSRMGAPRCAACSVALGLPQGNGAPYNVGLVEP